MQITDKEKLVRLTMKYVEEINPWDLIVFYDMLLNLPEEIITQWILRYGYRDSITVHVPEKTMNTHWGMKVSVTTLGEFAHEIYSYWYDLPSKELYTPAREWIDNWKKTCTDKEHKTFYEKSVGK